MVEVEVLGTRLGVAPRPRRDVHRVDRCVLRRGVVECQHLLERILVDPAFPQRGVEAAPAPPVNGDETQQVHGRRHRTGRKQGITQLKEGVGGRTKRPRSRERKKGSRNGP